MLGRRRGSGASGGLGGSGRRARQTVRGPRAEDDERDNAPQAGGSPRGRGPGPDPSRDAGAGVLPVRAERAQAGGLAQLPGGQPLADPDPAHPDQRHRRLRRARREHPPRRGVVGRPRLPRPAVRVPAGGRRSSTRTHCSSPSGTGSPNGSSSRSRCPTPGTRRTSRSSTGAGSRTSASVWATASSTRPGWRPALSVDRVRGGPDGRAHGRARDQRVERRPGPRRPARRIVGPLSAFASAGYKYNGRRGRQVEDQFVSGVGLAVRHHADTSRWSPRAWPTPTGARRTIGTPTGSPGWMRACASGSAASSSAWPAGRASPTTRRTGASSPSSPTR